MSDINLIIPLSSRSCLLNVIRERIQLKHCSIRAEAADAGWIKCHILFHDKRNVGATGTSEPEAILRSLATERNTSTPTILGLLFRYREVRNYRAVDWKL